MNGLNYTLVDLTEIAIASLVLYPLVLLLPGYVLGWYTNALDFRARPLVVRLLLSVMVGWAACPAVINLAVRSGGFTFLWALYALMAAAFVASAVGDWRAGRASVASIGWDRWFGRGALAAVGGGVLVALLLVDVQIGPALFHPHTDNHVFIAAYSGAIARTGVPPADPFFYDGAAISSAYHYYWHQVPAVVTLLAGGSVKAPTAVIAGCVWTLLGLMTVVAVFVRERCGDVVGWMARRRAMIAIGLLAVAGLDIIPIGLEGVRFLLTGHGRDSIYAGDFWNIDTFIVSWIGLVIGTPHDTLGVISAFAAFMLIGDACRKAGAGSIGPGLLAALALATTAGSAIWVALVVAPSFVVYAVIVLTRSDPGGKREFVVLTLIGIGAVVAVGPHLLSLIHLGEQGARSGLPYSLAAVRFTPLERVLDRLQVSVPWVRTLASLAVLPINYFAELGFLSVVGAVHLKRLAARRGDIPGPDLLLVVVLIASVLVHSLVRSDMLSHDLRRAMIPAQMVMLLWSAEMVDAALAEASGAGRRLISVLRSGKHRLMVAMVVLGVMTSVHHVAAQRMIDIVMTHDVLDHGGPLRALQSRRLYEWVGANTDESASVLVSRWPKYAFGYVPTLRANTIAFSFHLYGNRQAALFPVGIRPQGLSKEREERAWPQMRSIFLESPSIDSVAASCERLGVTHIVVTHADAVWKAEGSWANTVRPIASTDFARVFDVATMRRQ